MSVMSKAADSVTDNITKLWHTSYVNRLASDLYTRLDEFRQAKLMETRHADIAATAQKKQMAIVMNQIQKAFDGVNVAQYTGRVGFKNIHKKPMRRP